MPARPDRRMRQAADLPADHVLRHMDDELAKVARETAAEDACRRHAEDVEGLELLTVCGLPLTVEVQDDRKGVARIEYNLLRAR